MPRYDYLCEECTETFEEEQRIHDEPLKDCPICGSKGSLKRLIGSTSFKLSGGGWFAQGYQKKKG